MAQIVDIDRYLCTGGLIYLYESGPFPFALSGGKEQ
ncbi:hypothetical protein OKW24_003504 [Peribacillus simplex]|nr:hypothetical protein [Peribacillus simplex]